MGKASSPKTPDYAAAAEKTAAGNLASAQQATAANRPNMYTPYGSSTWTNNQTLNQPAYDAAMQNYQQALQKYNSGSTSGSWVTQSSGGDGGGSEQVWQPGTGSGAAPIAPDKSQFMTGDNWTNTVTLSPQQQSLMNQDYALKQGLFGAQNNALDRVNATMSQGFDLNGLPAQGQVLDYNNLKYGDVLNTDGLKYGSVLDTNGLPQAGNALTNAERYDPTQNTNNAADLIMSRINPQMAQQEESLRTRLANMGVTAGSEAWNNEMRNWNQQKNDAVQQAHLQGINLGMQQQGVKTAEQAQQYNQQTGLRQLAAALQQQQYGQQDQNLGRYLGAQSQRYGQQSNNNSQYMNAQNNYFNQASKNRNDAFQEQAYTRALPFNELSALMGGNSITMPQFQSFVPQATTGGVDYSGAAQNQYRTDLGNVNAQNAQSGNIMSGLFGIGSTMLGAPSTSIFGKLLGV